MGSLKDEYDCHMDKKLIKKKLFLIFISFLLSSISIIPIVYIPENKSGFSLVALISMLALVAFGLVGSALYLSIGPYRKKYEQEGIYSDSRTPESRFFFPFFTNKFAAIFDVLLIICLLFSFAIIRLNLPDEISALYGVLLILSFEFHVILNGKNFNFYNHFKQL